MAFDAYMKIDGIPGESSTKNFEQQIQLLAFNHSLQQPPSASISKGGGLTTGRSEHGDFNILKHLDIASPLLAMRCSDGTHIKEATITLVVSGGADRVPFMQYKLEDCLISAVNPSGQSTKDGVLPTEQVSFRYGKISWKYTQQDKTGKPTGNSAGSWNLATNATA